MDVDFNEFLAASMEGNSQQIQVTSANHINTNADFSANLKYRVYQIIHLWMVILLIKKWKQRNLQKMHLIIRPV